MNTHIDASQVLQQLGQNQFIAMTGARQFLHCGDTLRFRVARGLIIEVRLDADDTYTLRISRVRKLAVKVLHEVSGVYADNLRSTFTTLTGLDTHL